MFYMIFNMFKHLNKEIIKLFFLNSFTEEKKKTKARNNGIAHRN